MISPSIVRKADRVTTKQVKNLGWLLRNWQMVTRFDAIPSPNPTDDIYLIAHLSDGRTYETGFASKTVMVNFLNRPIFAGLELSVDGKISIIGEED